MSLGTVVLVGPMGSGKSTVGRALAARIGCDWVDTDTGFEERHGPVPDFFAAHGEPAFRQREEEVVGDALDRPAPLVISLGGGAVLSAVTRQRLAGPGAAVVYLTVDEAEVLARLDGGAGRPILAGDPARSWRRILAERHGLYREVAQLTVDTTGRGAQELAASILETLTQHPDTTDSTDSTDSTEHRPGVA